MPAKRLTKNYDWLTPEERFRLILAASGRGDEVERGRLVRTGKRLELSLQDHAPYACAFEEIALLTFLEALEDASQFSDAFVRLKDVLDWRVAVGPQHSAESGEADAIATEQAKDEKSGAKEDGGEIPVGADNAAGPVRQRYLAQAVAGYVLQTKVDGWKLFCEEMGVPPFLLWNGLPGFSRLALNQA